MSVRSKLKIVDGTKSARSSAAYLSVDLIPADGEEHETDDLQRDLRHKQTQAAASDENKRTIIRLPTRLNISSTLRQQNSEQGAFNLKRTAADYPWPLATMNGLTGPTLFPGDSCLVLVAVAGMRAKQRGCRRTGYVPRPKGFVADFRKEYLLRGADNNE